MIAYASARRPPIVACEALGISDLSDPAAANARINSTRAGTAW